MDRIDNEVPFDISEFGMDIPPIPEEIQEQLLEWGGNTEGIPNVRIVRGTDPEIVDWCAGEWIPRYTFPEVETVNYAIWHKPDGTKKIMTPAEAKVMDSSTKIEGIILPVTETKVRDWLIPRYFVEVFRPSSYFGNKEAWDSQRMIQNEDGTMVDLMGDFPENGQYETWFCIEDVDTDSSGKVTKTKFRALDDEVMETLREMIETGKTTTALEQHQKATRQWLDESKKNEDAFRQTVKDALNERIDRIVQTPSTARKK